MLQPIILAAGKGTRMGSELPKALCIVAGKPMLQHVLDAFDTAGNCERPVVVVGHKGEQVTEFVKEKAVTVEQKELTGTGTAAKVGMSAVPEGTSRVFIMYADNPFIKPASIRAIEKAHEESGATITLGTITVPNFKDWYRVFVAFGRVLRNHEGQVQEIREYKNANEHEQAVREVNPGFYCVDAAWLRDALTHIERNPLTQEYYLTDIISLALYEDKKVQTVPLTPEEGIGVNSPDDASQAEAVLQS